MKCIIVHFILVFTIAYVHKKLRLLISFNFEVSQDNLFSKFLTKWALSQPNQLQMLASYNTDILHVHMKHGQIMFCYEAHIKIRKTTEIRNRYNQEPHQYCYGWMVAVCFVLDFVVNRLRYIKENCMGQFVEKKVWNEPSLHVIGSYLKYCFQYVHLLSDRLLKLLSR